MAVIASILLCFSGLVAAQQACEISSSLRPALTMQFTPSMPTQRAPTSTIYGAIMTEYLNVVDCDYVMVENIDDNPAQVGQFTTKITVPYLTVYRVGCMPVTTAVTRRELRGYDLQDVTHPQTRLSDVTRYHKQNHDKRDTSQTEVKDGIYSVAGTLAQGIDPTNPNITVGAYKFLLQINTALFALNLVNSGLPLDLLCEELRNATVQVKLIDSSIDPQQAGNLVCWAEQYGLYFGMSNTQLLADLAALEYAVQIESSYYPDLPQLCENLDYSAASLLGININGIREYVCNGTSGVLPSSSGPTITKTMTWNSTSPTGMSYTGSYTVTAPAQTTGTSNNTGYATTTGIASTGYSIVYGTQGSMLSSATSAAGTIAPWINSTTTQNHGATALTADGDRGQPTQSKARQPMNPLSPFIYPPRFRRHGQRD